MATEGGSAPRVVVGVDGSAESIRALKWAAGGHPATVLAEESRQADLLVLGHRGHGAFTGMPVGPVSTHSVTNAECPVLVVRARA